MNAEELLYIGSIWDAYFPRDVYMPHDPRLTGILIFRDFFHGQAGRALIDVEQLANQKYVHFDALELNSKLPFSDFELSLKMRPTEVMGFLGIALSMVAKEQHPHCAEPFVIRPRFYNLSTETNFGDVKSSTVGQVVSVRGHVVRVSPCRPLVESANFLCAKCMKYTFAKFEDGIFIPPAVCSTEK
jgi:DNA helicase MCM8